MESARMYPLYRLLHTIRRNLPGLLPENCASDGRRIDSEILSGALSEDGLTIKLARKPAAAIVTYKRASR